MNWKCIRNWIGFPVAAWALLAGIVAGLDYLGVRPVISRELVSRDVQLAANTSAVQLIRWQLLDQRRRTQGLSPGDLREYCALSRILGLKGEGCA